MISDILPRGVYSFPLSYACICEPDIHVFSPTVDFQAFSVLLNIFENTLKLSCVFHTEQDTESFQMRVLIHVLKKHHPGYREM